MLTVVGATAAAVMVVSYALEQRGRIWIAVFAAACAATAGYGIATEAWIFACLEAVWSVVATKRFLSHRSAHIKP